MPVSRAESGAAAAAGAIGLVAVQAASPFGQLYVAVHFAILGVAAIRGFLEERPKEWSVDASTVPVDHWNPDE